MPIFQRFHASSISSPAAFSQLYESARLPVFRYIFGLTGGPQAEVEDLVAETFIRAWKARHGFEGEAQAAVGWLIRIARRLVIDDYRRAAVRRTHKPPADDPSPDSLPEQNALISEQRKRLITLLADLRDEPREILTMRYMLGWKVGEIASHLDLTEDNVSVTIHRTLASLREMWAEGQSDEPSFSEIPEKIP